LQDDKRVGGILRGRCLPQPKVQNPVAIHVRPSREASDHLRQADRRRLEMAAPVVFQELQKRWDGEGSGGNQIRIPVVVKIAHGQHPARQSHGKTWRHFGKPPWASLRNQVVPPLRNSGTMSKSPSPSTST